MGKRKRKNFWKKLLYTYRFNGKEELGRSNESMTFSTGSQELTP